MIEISDVARRTGLQTSALRYYERRGLIQPTGRAGGRRLYEESVLGTLAAISLFQEIGFTIAEIKQIMDGKRSHSGWETTARAKLRAIDDHLASVQAARALLEAALACRCDGFQTCELAHGRSRHRTASKRLVLSDRPDHER